MAMQGLGAVSFGMLEYLTKEGAKIVGTDIDPAKIEKAKSLYGITGVSVDEIYDAACDIFSPCALGASVNVVTLPVVVPIRPPSTKMRYCEMPLKSHAGCQVSAVPFGTDAPSAGVSRLNVFGGVVSATNVAVNEKLNVATLPTASTARICHVCAPMCTGTVP